ncbi:MAG: HAD-IA family hydrolase [Candidatus Eisenbacteria sp.]|nr:HAD-IA family hydrolase [Candidatus Eisenbacteria bacterium]
MIRGVFFDAGNTILFPDYYIYRDICEAPGVEAAIDVIVRAEARARSAFDRSVADSPGSDVHDFWAAYYTPFFEALGVPDESIPDAIDMTRVANDTGLGIWKEPVEGLDATLDNLSARDLLLGVISNSDGRLEWRLDEIGILDRFDFVIDSAIVGVSKPDRRIFEDALKRSSLSPEEAVYVGDYYEVDVRGARAAGMSSVLFDPVGAYDDVDCEVISRLKDIVDVVDGWMDTAGWTGDAGRAGDEDSDDEV